MNRKILTIVVCLFILIALPIISLYYSFQGASLRKSAMQELSPKGELPQALIQGLQDTESRYWLIGQPCEDTTSLIALIEQFKDEKVKFAFPGDSLFTTKFSTARLERWNKSKSIVYIKASYDQLTKRSTCAFTLTDKKFQILHQYDFTNVADRTRMIEHIALLVTKKK